jgi:phospholipid/cholesterol/gamma-HCH transport system substrate-binding protein
MTGVADWSMATTGFDGLSHYYAGVAVADPTTAANASAGLLPSVLPRNTFNPVPLDPNDTSAVGGSELPGVPAIPRLSPPQERGNSTPPDRTSTPPSNSGDGTSATGLSPQQEDSMFGQLLGGGR